MNKATVGESNYVKNLRVLIKKIHDVSPIKDSAYEQAMLYFQQQPAFKDKSDKLSNQIAELEANASKPRVEEKLKEAKDQLKALNKEWDEQRIQRHHKLLEICDEILSLVEGSNQEEARRNFSRVLGSILLITPTDNPKVAFLNQKSKHLYKAVLCLLLLEQMLQGNEIANPFVQKLAEERVAYPQNADDAARCEFRRYVKIPLLMTSLMQDIGQYHQDAQLILKGKEGNLNEFRTLEKDDRINLLKISYEQTVDYLRDGIGCDAYVGNSKEERAAFNLKEKEKLKFILTLIKSSFDPQQSIGNLLKIPQIYASVVLSTKSGPYYDTLPKATMVLEKGAEKGALNGTAVTSFIKIVGHFPQGFGVTFIPKDSDKRDLDRYEYAIVNGLYPENPHLPLCRSATKNLTFSEFGQDLTISMENNLYFPQARAKLEKMSKERLLDILSKLVSNFEERKELDLIPKCWHPYTFFSYAKHQNLWNKAGRTSN
ncbi:hypothetical protein P2G88_09300 [Aliiglaciecola sp. CAU 1673]|uniref:hypothetical protein n=1 Tax=Aliiglaciecola sp. CAU 1673 TaxID=3032595 RepID=UPI0023DCD3E8|nr:hypothetical protein [Aliiglaciecola sp. CAU 1673]MDF2178447.1 hypothetical protein [Aliiglaciecola sp. CAU 1673]